jgi:Ca2+-binding RTX toxin-like protein
MAVFIISTDITQTDVHGFVLNTSNSTLIVDREATVLSQNASGLLVGADHAAVTVRGTVAGGWDALLVAGSSAQILIEDGGLVQGNRSGLSLDAVSGEVVNRGSIVGNHGDGIVLGSPWGISGPVRIVNDGLVSGTSGILMQRADIHGQPAVVTLINTGTIRGDLFSFGSAEHADPGHNSVDLLTNRGLMIGDVALGGLDDRLVNRGVIEGEVRLGTGNDQFDNRGGEVTRAIFGGDGDDLFRPGVSEETIDGGAGIDVLDFRGSAGVALSLTDNEQTGTAQAAGDSYSGIEVVRGSRSGADSISGDGAANRLEGFGGNDALSGGGGNDVIWGGNGVDTVWGGGGSDVFVFRSLGECGDLVHDFRNSASQDDRLELAQAAFGGLGLGVLAASRFVTRGDNLAQDADDRFVFRTTDQTLWFDSNGNAAGGLTLIADFDSGASLTHADILIVA